MYTGNILDPIHGLVKISEIEKWILCQKPFNRLKRVKQNTFLYLVFPSSNHTRFEHSIGVMHLAHQIYLNANNNYETGLLKKEKYKMNGPSDFSFFSTSEKLGEEEEVLIQELRLAALLHDVGHGPMAHKFDEYTITGNDLMQILESDDELVKYKESFASLIGNLDKRVSHEIISCVFIVKLIADLKETANQEVEKFSTQQVEIINKLSCVRIINMIEPEFSSGDELTFKGIDYKDFFSSIISSFPLDADRMDYLYRDSYFSGVKYGLYDLSRLLMSFIPVLKEQKLTLAIKESGIDSVIRFIQSRTHLYNQVYFHKTNRAANCMLDFACRKMGSTSPVIIAKDYNELENFYWHNSDEMFLWNLLKNKISGIEAEIFEELLNRKLFKRIYQKKVVTLPSEKFDAGRKLEGAKAKIKSILIQLEREGIDVFVDTITNKVFKDYHKSKIKIVRKVDSDYRLETDWKTFNKELKILDCEVYMFRIYLRRNFNSSATFLNKKTRVLDSFREILAILDGIAS